MNFERQATTNNLNNANQQLDDLEQRLLLLKKSSIAGVVVKGLKETLKSIEANKAKAVFLAKDIEDQIYKKVIKDFCEMYSVALIEVPTMYELRDTLMLGIPSEEIIKKAEKLGKPIKISPTCYSAAILEFGDINKKYEDLLNLE